MLGYHIFLLIAHSWQKTTSMCKSPFFFSVLLSFFIPTPWITLPLILCFVWSRRAVPFGNIWTHSCISPTRQPSQMTAWACYCSPDWMSSEGPHRSFPNYIELMLVFCRSPMIACIAEADTSQPTPRYMEPANDERVDQNRLTRCVSGQQCSWRELSWSLNDFVDAQPTFPLLRMSYIWTLGT